MSKRDLITWAITTVWFLNIVGLLVLVMIYTAGMNREKEVVIRFQLAVECIFYSIVNIGIAFSVASALKVFLLHEDGETKNSSRK